MGNIAPMSHGPITRFDREVYHAVNWALGTAMTGYDRV